MLKTDFDQTKDGIATSSTDDMFAFSQIIASGDKVSAITTQMDKEYKKADTKEQDDDNDILAFSTMLPGNANEPKPVEVDETKIKAEQMASKELQELNDNDATSAFGALALAEEIQDKTEILQNAEFENNNTEEANIEQSKLEKEARE